MNNEQMREFLATAPHRREESEFIRQNMIDAVRKLPPDRMTMQEIAKESRINITTIWHRIKNSWKIKPVRYIKGTGGHRIGIYDREEILICLNAR
jgi:hypothetical protein